MSRFRKISAGLARRSKMARDLARGLTWPPFADDLPLAELQARYELPTSRYLDVDGLRVHLTDEGEGPVLVLIHGLMASLHTWDGWVQQLRDSFRVVRLDLPGFGLTGPDPARRYDGAGLSKIFDEVREQLGIERMFLAGSSLGGFLAWYYAVHHPERVDKLVLVDPLAYAMEPMPFIRLLGTPAGRWLGQRLDPRGSVARGVYDVFGDPARVNDAAIQRYQDLALRPGNRRALIDFCVEFMRMHEHNPYEADVARLTVPTLLMWGDMDRWIPPAHVALWQRDVPSIEVQIYEGAGHVPMEELPERTARDAREFFLRAR